MSLATNQGVVGSIPASRTILHKGLPSGRPFPFVLLNDICTTEWILGVLMLPPKPYSIRGFFKTSVLLVLLSYLAN